MTSMNLWLDMSPMLNEFWENFRHNLFKPLLLFFYMGFLVPILKVKLDFPHVIYQGLTIYLLIAIGWEGGEKLAKLPASELRSALGFMALGFATNFVIGITAYHDPPDVDQAPYGSTPRRSPGSTGRTRPGRSSPASASSRRRTSPMPRTCR